MIFATSMAFEVLSPEVLPNLAGYVLLVLLGILFAYPLWEAIFLGRPTSDAVNDYHKFVENKILDRFKGKSAYVVSLCIFILVYIVPIVVLILLLPGFEPMQIAFVWFLIFPLFFLNYFAASGQVSNIINATYKYSIEKELYPKKPGFIQNIMSLVFLIIAWVPFFLTAYNIYGPINALMKFQGPVPMEKGGSATAACFIYGDPDLPFWAAGQGVGLIDDVIPCAELVRRIMAEAEEARRRVAQMA